MKYRIAHTGKRAIFAPMLYQEPYPNNLPLAPEGSRMINFFIDLIISTAISSAIVKITLLPPPENDYPILTLVIIATIFTLIRLFYYFIFEAFLGGTIGQRLTKSQIVTLDKDVPTLSQYIVRSLSRPITGAGSFVSDDIQSFHDKNSKTYVITKGTLSGLELDLDSEFEVVTESTENKLSAK